MSEINPANVTIFARFIRAKYREYLDDAIEETHAKIATLIEEEDPIAASEHAEYLKTLIYERMATADNTEGVDLEWLAMTFAALEAEKARVICEASLKKGG